MKKFFDLGKLMDPRANRMPIKTGLGGKLKPITVNPLYNPRLSNSANPVLRKALGEFRVTDRAQIRGELSEQMSQAVDKVNSYLRSNSSTKGVKFTLHEESGQTYAVLTDSRSGAVTTFPGESMLAIAGNIKAAVGLLLNQEG